MNPSDTLRYVPDTGEFFFRDDVKPTGPRRPGKRAGWVHKSGYREISVNGKTVLEHRVAWWFIHGEWPAMDIDHKDGDTANNRAANLRLCTDSQNGGNQRLAKNNTSGYRGVYFNRDLGSWRAMVMVRGKSHFLGNYPDKELAALIAQEFREQHFGEFARAA